MFLPARRFLTEPRPPADLAARFLAAVILPPLLFFAIGNHLLNLFSGFVFSILKGSLRTCSFLSRIRGNQPLHNRFGAYAPSPQLFWELCTEGSRIAWAGSHGTGIGTPDWPRTDHNN